MRPADGVLPWNPDAPAFDPRDTSGREALSVRQVAERFIQLFYVEDNPRDAFMAWMHPDYIQHNPNAAQGLAGLVDYVRASRPVREIEDTLELPLIHLMAEGDYVTTAFVRPEKDANGETYYSSWFDLYRIEDGKIAEHWDPMLKSDPKIDPNDKRL